MRVLVGWDCSNEVDLLTLYLSVDNNSVRVAHSPQELITAFQAEKPDVVFFPVTFPDPEDAFWLYRQIQEIDESMQIIVAARPGETYPLSRFIRHGLTNYVFRDHEGEYLFLLQTLLEATVASRRAEQARQLAARLREEVESVRKLQESILPRDLRPIPGYEISARYEPSQIRVSDDQPVVLAGGDYYHVMRFDRKRMVTLVGDASGHGMKACMSIISMHTLMNQIQDSHLLLPHEFVSEINRKLCVEELIQGEGGFITLLYGYMENDEFHWTSAGHPFPLLHELSSNTHRLLSDSRDDSGPPLGLFDDAVFSTQVTPIPKNARLLIYTDGLSEAFPPGPNPPEFGLNGIIETLSEYRHGSLEETVSALLRRSSEFTQGAGRHDDTSLLLIQRNS